MTNRSIKLTFEQSSIRTLLVKVTGDAITSQEMKFLRDGICAISGVQSAAITHQAWFVSVEPLAYNVRIAQSIERVASRLPRMTVEADPGDLAHLSV